jgi:FkbM family methyltransferase
MLSRLFPSTTGCYVDVGAYEPTEFSNTRHFYDLGWSGVNIEPIPWRFERIRAARPRDVNLNVGIGSVNGLLPFYEMDPPTLSTFNAEEAERCVAFPGHRIVAKREIPVRTLRDVLAEHAAGRRIDFLSVDTEGFEEEVIRGNDWDRFRPVALLIEHRRYHPTGLEGSTTDRWEPILIQHGYRLAASNPINALYVRAEDEELMGRVHGNQPRR